MFPIHLSSRSEKNGRLLGELQPFSVNYKEHAVFDRFGQRSEAVDQKEGKFI